MPFRSIVVLCVTFAACSSNQPADPPAASPASTTAAPVHAGGPGVYIAEYHGGKAQIAVPAPADSPELQAIEAGRKAAGVPDAGYILVDMDNSSGTAKQHVAGVSVVLEDGSTIKTSWFFMPARKWEIKDPATKTAFDASKDKLVSNTEPLPGAKGQTLLISDKPIPATIQRVFIDFGAPIAPDTVEATKAGDR